MNEFQPLNSQTPYGFPPQRPGIQPVRTTISAKHFLLGGSVLLLVVLATAAITLVAVRRSPNTTVVIERPVSQDIKTDAALLTEKTKKLQDLQDGVLGNDQGQGGTQLTATQAAEQREELTAEIENLQQKVANRVADDVAAVAANPANTSSTDEKAAEDAQYVAAIKKDLATATTDSTKLSSTLAKLDTQTALINTKLRDLDTLGLDKATTTSELTSKLRQAQAIIDSAALLVNDQPEHVDARSIYLIYSVLLQQLSAELTNAITHLSANNADAAVADLARYQVIVAEFLANSVGKINSSYSSLSNLQAAALKRVEDLTKEFVLLEA